MNSKNVVINDKCEKLTCMLFKSIGHMLNTTVPFEKFDKKYKNVPRYLAYFKECSYIKINHIYVSYEMENDLKKSENKQFIPTYHKILNNLRRGNGIRSYLSSQILRLRPDNLYNDWSILHLHMDTKYGSKSRSDKMVLIRIFNMNAYVLKITKHGFGAFSTKGYLQIIYNNWPESLNILHNAPVPHKIDLIRQNTKQISKFRQKGINQSYIINDNNGGYVYVLGNCYNGPESLTLFDWRGIRNIGHLLYLIFRNYVKRAKYKNILKPGHFVYYVNDNMFGYYNNKNKLIIAFNSFDVLNLLHRGFDKYNTKIKIRSNNKYLNR